MGANRRTRLVAVQRLAAKPAAAESDGGAQGGAGGRAHVRQRRRAVLLPHDRRAAAARRRAHAGRWFRPQGDCGQVHHPRRGHPARSRAPSSAGLLSWRLRTARPARPSSWNSLALLVCGSSSLAHAAGQWVSMHAGMRAGVAGCCKHSLCNRIAGKVIEDSARRRGPAVLKEAAAQLLLQHSMRAADEPRRFQPRWQVRDRGAGSAPKTLSPTCYAGLSRPARSRSERWAAA